eukprot:8224794-Pyramimonas_sp.AAC.1
MAHGAASAEEIKRLREEGDHAVLADVVIDDMSAHGHGVAAFENSAAGHLRWLADRLSTKQI